MSAQNHCIFVGGRIVKVCGEVYVVGANESAIESNDSCYWC